MNESNKRYFFDPEEIRFSENHLVKVNITEWKYLGTFIANSQISIKENLDNHENLSIFFFKIKLESFLEIWIRKVTSTN